MHDTAASWRVPGRRTFGVTVDASPRYVFTVRTHSFRFSSIMLVETTEGLRDGSARVRC